MVFKASARLWQSNYVKASGLSAIYLRVSINGQAVPQINLNIDWPPKYWNSKKCVLLPRHADDQQAADYALILDQQLSRCNEIFTQYRLSKRPLLIKTFQQEYHDYSSKTDFILFYERELTRRYKTKQISKRTWLNHNNTLNKLKGFMAEIPFGVLSWRFGEEFNGYLLNECKIEKQNTRWTHHKDVKTYLARAAKEHIRFEDPYSEFSISEVDGDWLPVRQADLRRLLEHYDTLHHKPVKREALRKFLFCCYTGLRISDVKLLKAEWINFEQARIHFRPYKQRKFDVVLNNKLNATAMRLMADAKAENKGRFVFAQRVEQYENRLIKAIGQELEINEPLHFHVGRHTFCTMFIECGGSEAALRQYMGWKKANMTKKYVKPHQEMVDAVVDRL